jgi:hypothetical protein
MSEVERETFLPTKNLIETTVQIIRNRSLPEGGFAMVNGESFRPDATAWAVMALEASGNNRDLTIPACRRLAENQHSDGRISVIADNPESYWPTPLAVLAWKKFSDFELETKSAIRFLLATTGKHWLVKDNAVVGHDTSIRGWPWIGNTHSWIDPTSLAILALKICGYSEHERVLEGVRMILDRQLFSGGWNVGATKIFGNELLPIPECTGHALSALAGLTELNCVKLSINYLRCEIDHLRTPLSLSWAIFGLTSWSYRPPEIRRRILDSLALQKRYGIYDTTLLAQLVVAYLTSGNLIGLFHN